MSTSPETARAPIARPGLRFLLAHPAHILALGFGSGLAPRAPGTAGTVFGWALHAALVAALPALDEPSWIWAGLLAAAFLIGVPACTRTGRDLGVEDHGAMVWDEIVAILCVLVAVPPAWPWQVAAVLLFRVLDIAKPPPISWIEARSRRGFGVMIDDLAAALIAIAMLDGLRWAI